MTKRPRTLSAAFVRTVNGPGVYGDGRGGRGLSLRVHRTLDGRITKTWRQRVRIEGRLTSIGLGPYPEVTLAEARQKALDNSRGRPPGPRPARARHPDVCRGRRTDDQASPRRVEGRESPSRAVGVDVPSPRRPTPRQARGPDHERGRAPVSRADLELEACRRAQSPAPDRRRVPLVHWPELPSGQPGRPGGRGVAEGKRQRAEPPSRAPAWRGRGRAPGASPDH